MEIFAVDPIRENGTVPTVTGRLRNLSDEETIHMMYVLKLELIGIPLIVSVGLTGNTISAVIFLNQKLRKISCSLYLAARAVSDSGFLLCLFLIWLEHVKYPLINTQGVCQIEIFMSYLCGFMPVWFIVWVTVENFFRICQPFKVSTYCTVSKARWVIFLTTLIGAVVYSFSTWTNGIVTKENRPLCFMIAKFEVINTILTYSDCVITLALPTAIILLITGRIVFTVLANYRMIGNNRRKGSGKLQTKVTQMLFWVSLTFLVLNLPSHIVRLRAVFLLISKQTTDSSPLFYSVQRTLQMIYYLSFAANFFIYITVGKSFRDTFSTIFCRPLSVIFKNHRGEGNSETLPLQVTTTESNSLNQPR